MSIPSPITTCDFSSKTNSRNTTVGDVARKVVGDAPLAYVEGAGGVRVAEDDMISVGKNDVRLDQAFCNRVL